MTTDKTLADAQPGGRVRLGNAPTIEKLARELLAKEWEKLSFDAPVEELRAGCELPPVVAAGVRAIVAALSANPFQDGQRDDSDLLAGLRDVEEHLYHAGSNPIHTATVRAAINALSAQPSPATCKESLQVQAPMVGQEDVRSQFEAWAEGAGYALTREDGRYEFAATRCAWTAWRAAAESRQIGAHEPAAWVPPNFFKKGVVAATARRNPPSETAVELRGEYVPLYLSAQPSPGGQGDGVRCSKCKDRGYLDVDVDVDDSGGSIGNIEACPHCALAARQPVEVSEGGFRAAASRQTASAESNATAEALIAAARQLNKQPDNVALGETTEFCSEKGNRQPVGQYEVQTENGPLKCSLAVYSEWQKNEEYIKRLESDLEAARQPVGEPVAWMRRSITYAAVDGRTNGERVVSERKVYEDDVPLYRHPAQAVDLEPVRELLQRRMAQWRSHLPADPGAPGTREIETKGEHDYNNDVRIYREGIAVMDEALALIGQTAQAVDLGKFRDLIGFAVLQAINLPETDPRRDFIRQANEFIALIDGKAVGK